MGLARTEIASFLAMSVAGGLSPPVQHAVAVVQQLWTIEPTVVIKANLCCPVPQLIFNLVQHN